MSVRVNFGNLSVEELETRLKISLSEEDKKFFISTHQSDMSKELNKLSWHLFELPFEMHVGSLQMFYEIKFRLVKYNFEGQLNFNIKQSKEEKVENIFQLKTKSGFPRYLVKKEFNENNSLNRDSFYFLKLIKENKKSLIYQVVSSQFLYSDLLQIDGVLSIDDYFVPDDDNVLFGEIKILKSQYIDDHHLMKYILKSTIKNQRQVDLFLPWSGQRISWSLLNTNQQFSTYILKTTYKDLLTNDNLSKKFYNQR